MTGQHNDPNSKDQNSRFASKYEGQSPAIWSSDMGFAKDGDPDSYLARPDIVREAIRQHKKGSIITICWHAVPPTADEPVTFQPHGPVNMPRVSKASWLEESRSIKISSLTKYEMNGHSMEMKSNELWSIPKDENVLKINVTSVDFKGVENTVKLVYEKQ